MENENFAEEEKVIDEEADEGFMKGYEEDEEVEECAECGSAIKKEKKISLTIEGEEYNFCSDFCSKEFEETMGKNE